jgi:hypothetical protein
MKEDSLHNSLIQYPQSKTNNMKTSIITFNGDQFIVAYPGFGIIRYTTEQEAKAFFNRRGVTKTMTIYNKSAE